MTLSTTETVVTPEVTTEVQAPVTTPETPAVTEGIQREDFVNAPFLRNKREQEPAKPTEEVKVELETEPKVEPTPEVKTEPLEAKPPEADTPEAKTEGEPSPEAIKLPDGSEVTPEEIVELKKGAMMQADYTKKTQQLAEEKRQFQAEVDSFVPYKEQATQALGLWQAIERDPIGTIEKLQEHYASQGVFEAKDPDVLAREDRLRQLDQETATRQQTIAQQQEQEVRQWVTSQFDLLSQNPDFDRAKTAQYMIDNNILDPQKAYEMMSAPTLRQQTEALKAEKEALQKEMEAKMEAKVKEATEKAVGEYIKTKTANNNTPPPVGASVGGSPPVQINRPLSMQDAKKAALARLGTG